MEGFITTENLADLAINAALEAGQAILEIYNDPSADFNVEQKADHSPLTIADRKSHEIIASRLQQTPFPLLSEEGVHLPYSQRKKWETLWIVDPLDGTKEFIKRNGEFTVNIAWVQKGEPLIGVIYVPVKNILYYGIQNQGAYKVSGLTASQLADKQERLNAAIRLPLHQENKPYVVVASRSHMNEATRQFIEKIGQTEKNIDLTSIGSSLKICLVAEGSADVYPRFAPTMEWDTAAGHAIAKAAGKNIYQTDQQTPLHYNKEDLLNPWFIVKK